MSTGADDGDFGVPVRKSAIIIVSPSYFGEPGVWSSAMGGLTGPGAVRRDPAIPIAPGRRG